MNFQSITITLENNQIIKLDSDCFMVEKNDEEHIIKIFNDFMVVKKTISPDKYNKIKSEYEKIDDNEFVPVHKFPLYEINKSGIIRNAKTKKIVKPRTNVSGYNNVNIMRDGKQKFPALHRLVASTFLYKPPESKQVNHKNHNTQDNHVNNLEWTTVNENMLKRRYPNDVERLPENCTKIDSINNKQYDKLYYKDSQLWYDYDQLVRPYNLNKSKTSWTINGDKIHKDTFLNEYPQFQSDFDPK